MVAQWFDQHVGVKGARRAKLVYITAAVIDNSAKKNNNSCFARSENRPHSLYTTLYSTGKSSHAKADDEAEGAVRCLPVNGLDQRDGRIPSRVPWRGWA